MGAPAPISFRPTEKDISAFQLGCDSKDPSVDSAASGKLDPEHQTDQIAERHADQRFFHLWCHSHLPRTGDNVGLREGN
jgi:hypothetical protein